MYSAYLFDLDGTIYLGDALLPGAAETVATLRAAGWRTIFLSNNPTRTRQQYAVKLTDLGIPTAVDDVVTAAFVPGQWLRQAAPQATLFVVGEEPLKEELRAKETYPLRKYQTYDVRLNQVKLAKDHIRCIM